MQISLVLSKPLGKEKTNKGKGCNFNWLQTFLHTYDINK